MAEALVIRHLAFEDLGAFASVIAEAGLAIRYLDVGVDSLGPVDPRAPALLVVLGGPIGAYEDAAYPFLGDETALIRQRLEADLPTLGICLGAQLMARALGSRVYPGPAKEIGFAPVTLSEAGAQSCLAALTGAPVLHWHGDTFDLPAGAVRLASTEICANQAFARGPNILGLQFHPEVGAQGFERWLIGHALELAQAGIDVADLRDTHQRLANGLETRARACIAAWLAQLRR